MINIAVWLLVNELLWLLQKQYCHFCLDRATWQNKCCPQYLCILTGMFLTLYKDHIHNLYKSVVHVWIKSIHMLRLTLLYVSSYCCRFKIFWQSYKKIMIRAKDYPEKITRCKFRHNFYEGAYFWKTKRLFPFTLHQNAVYFCIIAIYTGEGYAPPFTHPSPPFTSTNFWAAQKRDS